MGDAFRLAPFVIVAGLVSHFLDSYVAFTLGFGLAWLCCVWIVGKHEIHPNQDKPNGE